MKTSTRAAAVLALLPFSASLLAQQPPPQSLDDAWLTVCAQAQPGTDFFDRCQEILNAGPGSGDRRSAAAVGNNLGTTGAQGRASNRIDEAREDDAENIDYEEDFGRWSIHVNANARRTERDASAFENGFESDFFGINGGFDYRFGDTWSAGAIIGYQDSDTDFDFNAGTLDTSGWSLAGVLNGQLGPNAWFNAYTGISSLDYDNRRNINYTIILNAGQPNEESRTITAATTSDTEGDQLFGGAAIGFGGNSEALRYGLSFGLDMLDTDIDGYTESGGNGLAQAFSDQSITSLTASITGNLSYTSSQSWGILMPYARLRYEHEFDDDSRTLSSRFVGDPSGFQLRFDTDDPDRDYMVAAIGVTGQMLSGNAWYVDVERLFMHDFLSEWAVNVGMRFEL